MEIKSSEFNNNEKIPLKYTCRGKNINPPLEFLNIPENTKSLALILDDPDAPSGTWTHWLVWNIEPEIRAVEENSIPNGAISGLTSFGKNMYDGPCPPSGTHRYFFKVYALDEKLNLSDDSQIDKFKEAIKGHILDEAELVGLFSS